MWPRNCLATLLRCGSGQSSDDRCAYVRRQWLQTLQGVDMADEHMEWQSGQEYHREGDTSLRGQEALEQQRSRTMMERVASIGGLSMPAASRAIVDVLSVLERRISGGEARRLEEELPAEVREWMAGAGKPTEAVAEKFDRAAFFQRVEQVLEMSSQRIGPVVAGVFAAVREQVSEAVARDVANQLPEDLKTLWDHPVPDVRAPDIEGVEHRRRRPVSDALRARRQESRQINTYLQFLRNLADKSGLDLDEAEDAAASVLCVLEQRLTQEEAHDLNAQLPMKLRELLVRCERHPGKPLRFDLLGMYEMVGEDLNLDPSTAGPIVQHVFATVKELISPGEAQDVASQLPRDIAEVWEAA